jgi:hypothetical protein
MYSNSSCLTVSNALLKSTKQVNRRFVPFWVYLQGSTLMVVRLPGTSEMRLRASENGTSQQNKTKWRKIHDTYDKMFR